MTKETIKPSLRWAVFARDGFTCKYCGRSPPDVALHCDHVKPESEGGKTEETNLVTACEVCNHGKGVKRLVTVTPADWAWQDTAREATALFPDSANALIEAVAVEGERLGAAGATVEAAGLCMALAAIRVGAEVCSLVPLPKRIGKKRFLAMCAAMFDEVAPK